MSSYEFSAAEKASLASIAVLAMIGTVVLFGSWFTVDSWEVAAIRRFGAISEETYGEGLHFKMPLIDDVVRMETRSSKSEGDAAASSNDQQSVTARIAVNWSISPSQIRYVYSKYGNKDNVAERVIQPVIQESVKVATAKFSSEDLVKRRAEVSEEMKARIREKVAWTGIQIEDVNIINFAFSGDYERAIEARAAAVQAAETAKNLLKTKEYEWQQLVVTAKAQKEAAVETARGNAEAIRIQAEAVRNQWGAEYVELKRIEKWDGKLPSTILGQNGQPLLNLK